MKLWAGLILLCFSYLASADSLRIVSSEFIPHNGEHLPNQGYAIQMLREIFASQQQEVHFEFLQLEYEYSLFSQIFVMLIVLLKVFLFYFQ